MIFGHVFDFNPYDRISRAPLLLDNLLDETWKNFELSPVYIGSGMKWRYVGDMKKYVGNMMTYLEKESCSASCK